MDIRGVPLNIHVYMYVCMHACMHACMHIYIYITQASPASKVQVLISLLDTMKAAWGLRSCRRSRSISSSSSSRTSIPALKV